MTLTEVRKRALELPADERRRLAEALWKSLESEPVPLPAWQRILLDERLAKLEVNPEAGSTWDEVERRVWGAGGNG